MIKEKKEYKKEKTKEKTNIKKQKNKKYKSKKNSISIIIVEPITPDNISAVCRLMKNFNFKNLILIKPKFKIEDLKYEIARKGYEICKKIKIYNDFKKVREEYKIIISTTAKPGKKITREYITLKELKKILLEEKTEEKNKKKINLEEKKTEILKEKTIGLLFGREDKGLLQKEIEESDILLTIETEKEQRALNLSHIIGIILHYFYEEIIPKIKEDLNNKLQKKPLIADEKEKKELLKKIIKIYEKYSKKNNNYREEKKETQKIVWKRIIGKNMITKKEIKTILGFMKEIEKNIEEKQK